MITIPTGDLTGILADVTPFAATDKDYTTLTSVRLEWDGDMLHAFTTDTIRVGWSSWHPDDDPEGEAQDDLFTEWGGADDPWGITLPLDDAKDIVSAYKLGAKEQRTPLTVDLVDGTLKVARTRDTGHSAITMVVLGRTEEFPDVRKLLADNDTVQPITGVAYGAKFLADFSKVRPRGPMELTFTGVTKATLVQIGKRFSGAIMPTRVGDERERVAADA